MTSEPSGTGVARLLDAAGAAIPEDALIAVAGDVPASGETRRRFVHFEPALDAQPVDSGGAIVALERNRSRGAGFLVLPAPVDAWLDELALFGFHCRSRYQLIYESAGLGAVLDLRRRRSEPAESGREAGEVSTGVETAGAEQTPDALDVLARSVSQLVRREPFTANEFRTFERHGVHVTPVHVNHPIPDTSQLSNEVWACPSELIGIDMNDDEQLSLLRDAFPQFREEYEAFPTAPTDDPATFHFGNGLFDGTDALVLYCMLRHFSPRQVIEVGSGYSTRLAAQASRVNGSTELVCIEPYPDEVLQAGFPGLASLITSRVEDVSVDVFTALGPGDVLFIDSSHVVRIGSDVRFLFLEVLPRLKPGVIVQFHDIFLPLEYPRDWVIEGLRFWNEQYLLQAFLTFNSEFRVLLANSYLATRHGTVLQETFPTSPWWGGGSFWMQRRSS